MNEKNSPSSSPFMGQCLCGSITYEVDEISPAMGHCHCSMCRKFHGAAFATFGEAKPSDFRWTNGEDLLRSFVGHNGSVRQFCKNCGSSMTFSPADNPLGLIEFSLGTLDSEIDLRPDVHIYLGSKANWFDICDRLPKFVAGRDGARAD